MENLYHRDECIVKIDSSSVKDERLMKNHYKYTSFVQKEQSLDNFYNYAVFNLEQPPPSSLPPPHRYVEIIVTGLNNTLKFVQLSSFSSASSGS